MANLGVYNKSNMQDRVAVLSFKILGGGYPEGEDGTYTDTNARNLGMRTTTTMTMDSVELTNLYAEPFPGTVKFKSYGGDISISAEFLEINSNNEDLIVIANGRNPNYYNDLSVTGMEFNPSTSPVYGELKVALIPDGDLGEDSSAIENCEVIQIDMAMVDISDAGWTSQPKKDGDGAATRTITFKGLSNPNENFRTHVTGIKTVNADLATDARYCENSDGLFTSF